MVKATLELLLLCSSKYIYMCKGMIKLLSARFCQGSIASQSPPWQKNATKSVINRVTHKFLYVKNLTLFIILLEFKDKIKGMISFWFENHSFCFYSLWILTVRILLSLNSSTVISSLSVVTVGCSFSFGIRPSSSKK